MKRLLLLLIVLLSLVYTPWLYAAGNETLNPVPANDASFFPNLQNFLVNELPDTLGRYFPRGWVYAGGFHSATGSCISPSFTTDAYMGNGNHVTEGTKSPAVTTIDYSGS